MRRRDFIAGGAALFVERSKCSGAECGKLNPKQPLEIEGFERLSRPAGGMTHDLYRTGRGPAVFICHELPGLYRKDIDLACHIAKQGFTAYLPLFFGKPGDYKPKMYALSLCLNPASEFTCFTKRTSKAARWLSAQLDQAHRDSGGKGVGVIGMCLTGSFPLAVLGSRVVRAAVICQPTMPILSKSALDLSDADLRAAISRTDVDVLGIKFSGDGKSPEARWKTLREKFKGRFHELIIDSGQNNHGTVSHDAHSVLGISYEDAGGKPTRIVFDRVVRYLDQRLSDNPTREPYPKSGESCPPGLSSCRSY